MSKWENFETEKEKKRDSDFLIVPELRANRGSPAVTYPASNLWGPSIKIALRQVAKRLPEYHLKVKNSYLPLTTSEGITVDTLGRWAWGVKGYAGHLMFEGFERNQIIIHYPEKSPPQLIQLLEKAIQILTKRRNYR